MTGEDSSDLQSVIGHRFVYDATVESVYDGDTVTLCVDLGFGLKRESQKFRLYGINAPEVRGVERPDGMTTRDWLREQMPEGSDVVIRSHRDSVGKYGRYLATIFKNGVDLNQEMVRLGLAEVNFYGDPPDA